MKAYHRVYAEINLDNIYHNIAEIKKLFDPGVKIMPVIKADGYGHGAKEVARLLNPIADCFAVAIIEEVIQLRESGITKPIMILGTVPPGRYDDVLDFDAIMPVYTVEMADDLSRACSRMGKKVKVHLVVDTGMQRIGLPCNDDGITLAKKICSYENFEVCGIFSHYATSDMADKTFALSQREKFQNFCDELSGAGYHIPCRHICNSAAITDMSDSPFDMVRPGIITYGLFPSDEVLSDRLNLRPAMELKSHVSFVKKVPADTGISYGLTYTTDSERIIATVPVGYADGYPRLLSNKGRVIVRGQYAPIVGRVCMDQFMIDVTDIGGVTPGDTVTLIGKDGNCFISADEIAAHSMTINYEIVCGIGKRVPRIYVGSPDI